jgi:putative hydrolase of the HAD superfamily
MFDFGGVVTTSPFEAFARYERSNGLPDGFVRRINATNPDHNAWARLERAEVDFPTFCGQFEDEARALGHEVDAAVVVGALAGEIRPEMVAAIEFCSSRFKTACLTNNILTAGDGVRNEVAEVLSRFDAVLESSKLGVRKPDPAFYWLACEALEVEPDEVVYLDDLGINLKPARAMGMATIKVTTPDAALAELFAAIEGTPDTGPAPPAR